MTTAARWHTQVRPLGSAFRMPVGGLSWRRGVHEVAAHAFMIAVMVIAMVSGSVLASIAGAVVLIAASAVVAAFSRRNVYLREHVVDLWAMALVLLVFLPRGAAAGHHVITLESGVAFGVVLAAWLAARVWLGRSHVTRSAWRVAVASAALTGAGLIVMAVLCG